MAGDVLPVLHQLRPWPAGNDERQVVVGRPGPEAATGAKVNLVASVRRQTADVRVVADLEGRDLVVRLGSGEACDERVMAVRAHDRTRTQLERRLTFAVPADTGDASFLDDQVVDGEPLAQLGSRLRRRVDQQLVEHGSPRGVGERGLVGPGGARDRHGAEVEDIGVDAGTARGQQPSQQAPLLERRHAGRVDEVRRDRVGGKCRLVDDEHVVALAGEQHRCWRAGAARPHHDGVEFGSAHVERGSYGRRARASSHGRAKSSADNVVRSYHAQTRPWRKANAVAAARDETPSLAKMFWRCRRTVWSLITSSAAIS